MHTSQLHYRHERQHTYDDPTITLQEFSIFTPGIGFSIRMTLILQQWGETAGCIHTHTEADLQTRIEEMRIDMDRQREHLPPNRHYRRAV